MGIYKNVNSVQELMFNIQNDISNSKTVMLKSVSEDIRNILYVYTQDFYNRYEPDPESYIRTYEFINSLTVRFLSEDEVEIGFDPSVLTLGLNQSWNQHSDRFYPISEIIDEGWTYRQDGSHALENAINYMKSTEFMTRVKSIFKLYGFRIL